MFCGDSTFQKINTKCVFGFDRVRARKFTVKCVIRGSVVFYSLSRWSNYRTGKKLISELCLPSKRSQALLHLQEISFFFKSWTHRLCMRWFGLFFFWKRWAQYLVRQHECVTMNIWLNWDHILHRSSETLLKHWNNKQNIPDYQLNESLVYERTY